MTILVEYFSGEVLSLKIIFELISFDAIIENKFDCREKNQYFFVQKFFIIIYKQIKLFITLLLSLKYFELGDSNLIFFVIFLF